MDSVGFRVYPKPYDKIIFITKIDKLRIYFKIKAMVGIFGFENYPFALKKIKMYDTFFKRVKPLSC
jgi:hypothetical protein